MKIDWEEIWDIISQCLCLALAIALGGTCVGLFLGSMYAVMRLFGM